MSMFTGSRSESLSSIAELHKSDQLLDEVLPLGPPMLQRVVRQTKAIHSILRRVQGDNIFSIHFYSGVKLIKAIKIGSKLSRAAAMAQWIHLRLPYCSPGFESHAFFNLFS